MKVKLKSEQVEARQHLLISDMQAGKRVALDPLIDEVPIHFAAQHRAKLEIKYFAWLPKKKKKLIAMKEAFTDRVGLSKANLIRLKTINEIIRNSPSRERW